MYARNNRASKYVRQKLIGFQEVDESTISAGDFNTPLSKMNRFSRKVTSLTDIYRLLHLTTAKYTFFSNSHGTCTKIDHILGHKAHLLKSIEIIKHMLSDHNENKLEISNGKDNWKIQNIWRLNNTLLNNTGQRRDVMRNLKIIWTKWT